jgi:hypothetical protein
VAGRFLHKLHAGREAEFGVDVSAVGLHGAQRDEKPCRDVLVAQPFTGQSHDVMFAVRE